MNKSVVPEKISNLLCEHDFGVLATSGREYPHTSLVTIIMSDDYRSLIFPTLRETRKYKNLISNPHVSVLLDNRADINKNHDSVYALSVRGEAHEVRSSQFSSCKEHFLRRHPQVTDILSLQQTALIQVTIQKLILVEGFQKVQEFDWS